MPQPGVGVEGVACLPSAVGRLCLRLVQYLQCQKETKRESESERERKERMSWAFKWFAWEARHADDIWRLYAAK